MKLLNDDLVEKLVGHPFCSCGDNLFDEEVLVKFFNPLGRAYWFILEAEKLDDDYLMFGYCDLGLRSDCAEWGYVSLRELDSIVLPYGMGIERDLYVKGSVRDNLKALGLEYHEW